MRFVTIRPCNPFLFFSYLRVQGADIMYKDNLKKDPIDYVKDDLYKQDLLKLLTDHSMNAFFFINT